MKKVLLLVAVSLTSVSVAHADTKIGVFDAQEVVQTVDEGKKATSTLEKEFAEKKKQFETKGKELEKMKSEMDSQKLVLSKDAYDKKEKDFNAKAMEYQKSQFEAQQEIQKREMTLTNDITKKINAVIQKMGKDGSFDFILEKNQGAVTYFKSGDLTDQVIAEYNKTYGGTSTAAPAPAAPAKKK